MRDGLVDAARSYLQQSVVEDVRRTEQRAAAANTQTRRTGGLRGVIDSANELGTEVRNAEFGVHVRLAHAAPLVLPLLALLLPAAAAILTRRRSVQVVVVFVAVERGTSCTPAARPAGSRLLQSSSQHWFRHLTYYIHCSTSNIT